MFDIPDISWMKIGEFESADAARECATSHLRDVLQRLMESPHQSADELYSKHLSFGEQASIFGEPEVEFDSNACVHALIRELTQSPDWCSEGWLQRSR
jgi:hypothetical protein